MHPLDRGFFATLKALYSSESEKWLVQNPGKVITVYELSGIFHKAYSSTTTVQFAEKEFRVTIIEPYNPEIIRETSYSP